MKIAITGVAGLIGSHLANWILDHVPDSRILGIDDLSTGYRENIPHAVNFKWLDLAESPRKVNALFGEFRPEYVFHCASFASEVTSPFLRRHTVRNTWLATASVLNACLTHPPKRLVFTSSIAVYGSQPPPFDESYSRKPVDPYGIGKTACEMDIEVAGMQHGLDYCILRLHNVYGPRQSLWVDDRNVFGIWMRQHLQGDPGRIYGDGQQRRAFSYIGDCLPSIWQSGIEPRASHEIINVGGAHPISIRDAAETVCNITSGRMYHASPRLEVQDAWATIGKSVDLLGYSEATPLFEGVTVMWQWAQRAWHQYPNRRNRPTVPYELDATGGAEVTG